MEWCQIAPWLQLHLVGIAQILIYIYISLHNWSSQRFTMYQSRSARFRNGGQTAGIAVAIPHCPIERNECCWEVCKRRALKGPDSTILWTHADLIGTWRKDGHDPCGVAESSRGPLRTKRQSQWERYPSSPLSAQMHKNCAHWHGKSHTSNCLSHLRHSPRHPTSRARAPWHGAAPQG